MSRTQKLLEQAAHNHSASNATCPKHNQSFSKCTCFMLNNTKNVYRQNKCPIHVLSAETLMCTYCMTLRSQAEIDQRHRLIKDLERRTNRERRMRKWLTASKVRMQLENVRQSIPTTPSSDNPP